jgi:predicted phage terminase large subunit-like protein
VKKLKTTVRPQLDLKGTLRRLECEESQLYFTRYFFKVRQSAQFLVNWHHQYLSDELEKVIRGETENLLINIAPGSTKTEMAMINFMARGFALNPWCRFLHLSYSDDLALKNSQDTRDLIETEEYQSFWPLPIAQDAKAKKRWNVVLDGKKAGGVYAAALGGQITGFRAGHMRDGFQGALLIDDPIKPEDAYSEARLKVANRRLISTVKSRKANPRTPIIMIMQRVGEKDCTNFVLNGGLPGKWKHIVIPAIIDQKFVEEKIPEIYQAQVDKSEAVTMEVQEGNTQKEVERFSYWPYKERISELIQMEQGAGFDADGDRISRHVFSAQWMQAPRALGGNIIKGAWFPRYKVLPKIKYRKIFADTAQKIKKRNDFTVFACYGLGEDGKLYLLDQIRGKWEGPDLEKKAPEFWNKHNSYDVDLPWVHGHPAEEKWIGQLRQMCVEDKSSGTGLIQKIKALNRIPVKDIQRDIDKLTRVMDIQGYLQSGLVCVPEEAPWLSDFIEECEAFTADDSHAFDDQIDPLVDAVNDLLSTGNKLEQWKSLI